MTTVVKLVMIAFQVYSWLILIRVLLSWIRIPFYQLTAFIYDMTEPYLRLFRKILPASPSMAFDFSPIIALFVLQLLQNLIYRLLLSLL